MRICIIAWFDPHGINTVKEHLNSIRDLSEHTVEIFNTFSFARRLRKILPKRLGSFDALVFHNTVTYNLDVLENLSQYFYPGFKEFPGIKIMMKQDEMRRIYLTRKILDSWGIDMLTSCLPESEIEKVYEISRRPRLKVMTTLTGYVTEEMESLKSPGLAERSLDVVYRGMPTPYEWGKLGQEKFEIARGFLSRAQDYGLKCDISARFEDRLSGNKWIHLLQQSRAALAVESGASIFDFDGEVEKICDEYREKFPNGSFQDIFSKYLHLYEGNVKYNQISPRHIEAAATKTVQILFEGEYSQILRPLEHYIPLKKDFSNMNEVVDNLRNDELCDKLISNCYQDIILSGNFTYRKFVEKFDRTLAQVRQ